MSDRVVTGATVEMSGPHVQVLIEWAGHPTQFFLMMPDHARDLGRSLLAVAARGGAAKPYTVEHITGTGCTILPDGGVMVSYTWLDRDGSPRAAHHCLTNLQAVAFSESFARVLQAMAADGSRHRSTRN